MSYLLIPLMVLVAAGGYALLFSHATGIRIRADHHPAVPAPEPRGPRDISRPYPRAKGFRSKLNRVCPVCGTGRETGDLDRRVLGWPAHRTCAEWLGDWKPPGYVPPPPYRPTGSVTAVAVSNSPRAQVSVGNGEVFSSEEVEVSALYMNGHITVNEARRRLDGQITASFGVPPVTIEQRGKPPGVPVITDYCECGMRVVGTLEWIRDELDRHRCFGCRGPRGASPRRRLPGR